MKHKNKALDRMKKLSPQDKEDRATNSMVKRIKQRSKGLKLTRSIFD